MNNYYEIKEFPGYFINVLGEVKNKKRLMKQRRDPLGRYFISLRRDKKTYTCLVHRLVAKTFLPNFYGYQECDHKNRDKSDNRLWNLRWCSKSQNLTNRSVFKNSSSGLKYILCRNGQYVVQINNPCFKFYKYFKTLDEAITYRDMIFHEKLDKNFATLH